MKFTSLLSNLIVEESRFQILYDKLVKPTASREGDTRKPKGLMDFETLKALILADPTTRVPQGEDIDTLTLDKMDGVKVGKYTQWMLKNFVKPTFTDERNEVEKGTAEYSRMMNEYRRLFMEDLFKVTKDLQKYERFKNQFPQDKRDINKLTVDDVFELTKDLSLDKTKATKSEKEKAKITYEHPGADVIFRGPNWTLVKIEDKGTLGSDAASFYGGYYLYEKGETRWCTSPHNSDHFKTYIKDGPLYVVLANNDGGKVGKKTGLPQERYQFHFPSHQFMDRHDKPVKLVELLNGKMAELKDTLKPELAKGLVQKGGDKVEINYPADLSGTFIALFGFDELFATLPVDIKHLLINNKSKDEIALDVPETISRFQSLDVLLLQNIVKTLPESVGSIKNLNFISLPDNKNLKSIPESISNLPNLAFLNLKGSPNAKIPESLKERLTDEGSGFYYVHN